MKKVADRLQVQSTYPQEYLVVAFETYQQLTDLANHKFGQTSTPFYHHHSIKRNVIQIRWNPSRNFAISNN